MVWENLADLGQHNSPRDTTQKSHSIGVNPPIFTPHLNKPQSSLKILQLQSPSKLQNHQIIFPASKSSSTRFLHNLINQIHIDNPFDIPWYDLILKPTQTYIDVNFLIIEGYDGHTGLLYDKETFYLGIFLKFLRKDLEEMGLSVYKVRHYAHQVDIAAV